MLQTLHIVAVFTMLMIGAVNLVPDKILLDHVKPFLDRIYSDVNTVGAVREKLCLLMASATYGLAFLAGMIKVTSGRCIRNFLVYGQCPSSGSLDNMLSLSANLDHDVQLEDLSFLLRKSQASTLTNLPEEDKSRASKDDEDEIEKVDVSFLKRGSRKTSAHVSKVEEDDHLEMVEIGKEHPKKENQLSSSNHNQGIALK